MNEITEYYYSSLLHAIRELDIDYEEGILLQDLSDVFHAIAYEKTLEEFGRYGTGDKIRLTKELNKKAERLIEELYY